MRNAFLKSLSSLMEIFCILQGGGLDQGHSCLEGNLIGWNVGAPGVKKENLRILFYSSFISFLFSILKIR